jgi:hypothetical protein
MLLKHETPRFRLITLTSALWAIGCFVLSKFMQFVAFSIPGSISDYISGGAKKTIQDSFISV